MKSLLALVPILLLSVACNKEPREEFQQKEQEINRDYREDVNEAAEDRQEEIRDAREEFRDEQKEEALDYVEESDSVKIKRDENLIKVQESEEQRRE